MLIKILNFLIAMIPLTSTLFAFKLARSRVHFSFWNAVITLHNLFLEIIMRKINTEKHGSPNLDNTDARALLELFINIKVSTLPHCITFNEKHFFYNSSDKLIIEEFLKIGDYKTVPISEVQELLGEKNAILYAHCLYVVKDYIGRGELDKKPHILRGIFI